MRRTRKLFLAVPCILLLVLCQTARAQAPLKAEGVIRDANGHGLQGATIHEKDKPLNAAMTDSAGHFSLSLKGTQHILVVSYIGFETTTTHFEGQSLSITLKPSKSDLNEAVVIGYQSMRRRDLTAAVSSIKGKEIEDIPEASFDQMLQGRLAGVSVLSTTGEPGAKPNIVIRGATNVDYGNANGGNTGPLYVIDGVIYDVNAITTAYSSSNAITGAVTTTNPLSLINPNDIESIDILKDASASAIYGARAGNGVIIVKTKRAQRGKPQVAVSGYFGATGRPQFRDVATGAAERALKLQLLNSQLGYALIQQNNIPAALTDSLNPAFNNDVDWQGLMIRQQAFVNNEDASVAGYSGNSSYRVALNHYGEQGILNGFSVERLAPHLSLNLNPIKGLNINTDLVMSSEKRHHGTGGSSGTLFSSWSFPSSLVQLNSTQLALYKGQTNLYDDNGIFSIEGNIGVTDTIVRNLYFKSNFSTTNYMDRWDYYSPAALNGVQNTAYHVQANNPSWTFENYLTWLHHFGDHHLALVGGVSAYDQKSYYTNAYASGIAISGITTLQTVPPGSNLSVYTTNEEKTTVSYYGRLSYDYKTRYLATVAFRRDASSIYSADYRWGTFPSVSAGWIASDENFFEPIRQTVNFLKFRASYGITGNDPGNWYGKYQALYADASSLISTNGSLVNNFGTVGLSGLTSTYNGTTVISPFPYGIQGPYNYGVSASTSVRWEKFPQVDFGGDMELFNSRVNLTVDWYQKDANDKYFYNIPAQVTTGYEYYSGNFVNVRNRGLEIGLSTHNFGARSKFQWNTNFNISFNKNYVTKLPNGNRDFLFGPSWFQQSMTIGKPLFNYKIWQINGVYATDAQVPVDPITGKKETFEGVPLQAGDPRYVDMNGDYNIDNNDKVIGGDPNPRITGGFGNTFMYKGFTLNIFCSYVLGRKIFDGYLSDALNGSSAISSWGSVAGPAGLTSLLNQFWQKPGDQTKYPRLVYPTGTSVDPWDVANSYFLENGSFLKVKQVNLSYNLPEKLIKPLRLHSFSAYAMVENLWMIKASKIIPDPELVDPTTGSSNVVYPSAKKLTVGIRMEL